MAYTYWAQVLISVDSWTYIVTSNLENAALAAKTLLKTWAIFPKAFAGSFFTLPGLKLVYDQSGLVKKSFIQIPRKHGFLPQLKFGKSKLSKWIQSMNSSVQRGGWYKNVNVIQVSLSFSAWFLRSFEWLFYMAEASHAYLNANCPARDSCHTSDAGAVGPSILLCPLSFFSLLLCCPLQKRSNFMPW